MTRLGPVVRDEQASLSLAVLVAIVVGGLTLVLLGRTMVSVEHVRFDRDFQLAVHTAEAGLNQALAEIEALPASSGQKSLTSDTMTASTELRGQRFRWVATRDLLGKWEIVVTGWHGEDVARTLVADVSDDPDYFVAAFGRVGVRMVGNNEAASFPPPGFGAVGSNGVVSIIGNSTADVVMLFGPEARCAQVDTTDNTCNDIDIVGQPTELDFATMIANLRADMEAACAGRGYEVYDPEEEEHALVTGSTYCFSRFETERNAEISVEVLPEHVSEGVVTKPAEVFVSGDVSIGNQNRINCPAESCDFDDGKVPDASALEIRTLAETVLVGNHSNIGAAISAPQAVCQGNPSGSQSSIYGSLICHQIGSLNTDSGSGNQGGWSFYFDVRLLELGGGTYQIVGLREEPSMELAGS